MNVGRKPLFVFNQDCREITSRVIQKVEEAGLRTLRSFDLDAVRSSSKGFICPIHGKSDCTCRMVILLIMFQARQPLTLMLEGLDHQTWVYLDCGGDAADEQVDPALTSILLQAFGS